MSKKAALPSNLLSYEPPESRPNKPKKWFVFNRSPLARKIIFFNLIALGILVSGVLYLNQSQDAQLAYRRAGLARQAEMISAALHSHWQDPAYADRRGAVFQNYMRNLVLHSDSIVQVYEKSGNVVFMRDPPANSKNTENVQADVFTRFFQSIWSVVSAPDKGQLSEDSRYNLQNQFRGLAEEAMQTEGRTKDVTFYIDGEIYVAVALPITGPNGTEGAILLSTRKGEIDAIIRGAREQILQMFLLATLSSIILSMVLANSIARPLRRLSAAAQNTGEEAGMKLNLARVNIPDITARPDEIGDLSRSMRNMTDALLERIDENKSFAADVSHEIKNPLTSLRSAVETLGYVEDDESRAALLEVIESDVERLDRLVTDISNASRLEGELVRDTWEDVDICALLHDITGNFSQRGGYPTVKIKVESDAQDCLIRGLVSRLAQVFTNLVGNALSFVPADGWVHVRVFEQGATLVVEVSDNGPGIPEDNLGDIFSRFYSERPVEQFGEHSGLGLAISKQIVEAHGGTITAQNTSPHGALFTVALPK